MKDHFSATLRRFAVRSEGATMIEFALVFPIMLLLTLGILEISLCMFGLVTLEAGLKQASRYGITSSTQADLTPAQLALVPTKFNVPGEPRTQMIGFILNQFTTDMIDLNSATIDTKTYGSFILIRDGEPYSDTNSNGQYNVGEPFQDIACPHNGVRDGPGTSTGNSVGAAGAIVLYTVTYRWKFFTPLLGRLLGQPDGNGGYVIPISSSMVVKNEPILSGSTFGC